jgi:hypothetical protein
MSLFDLQLFTLHVASHLVGEETIRQALSSSSSSSSSNDESGESRHLCSWRSAPPSRGNGDCNDNGDGIYDESSSTHPHRPQEPKETDEESRNASLVFLEVIFDWQPAATWTTVTDTDTKTHQPLAQATRTITMHVNALLRMSQDGTGLCVGVVPSGKRACTQVGSTAAPATHADAVGVGGGVGVGGVTLQELERHFEQMSIDVTSTPEIVLATTFANALLAMHSHSNGLPETAENTSLDRTTSSSTVRVRGLQSSSGSAGDDVQALIPLCYQDLQQTASWTIRQPRTTATATATTTNLDLSTSREEESSLRIPAMAMSMWMRSLISTAALTQSSTATFTTVESPLSAEKSKSISTPPTVQKQKQAKPATAAVVGLLTLFQQWRQTPVRVVKPVQPASAADPLHSAAEKEYGAKLFLDQVSPGTATHDNVPATGGSPSVTTVQQQPKKVVQIKRKHGFTRIPAKKKKTGKLKFAGAD